MEGAATCAGSFCTAKCTWEVRQLSKLAKPFALLAVLLWVAPGFAQVSSGAASVTLRATVEESFSAQPVLVPFAQPFVENGEPAPLALVVSLGWTLRPGRHFQIASATERRVGHEFSSSHDGPMSLRQLEISSHAFSFMPSPEGQLVLLEATGKGEEDAVGRAAFMMVLPTPLGGEDLTVRISIISL